jgi:hypothetical protein
MIGGRDIEAAALERARGRKERRSRVPGPELFTAGELRALLSAERKLRLQRRAPGLRLDASVLSDREKFAANKLLRLSEFGIWHPTFASMTDAEVAAAVEQLRGPAR